MPKPKQQRSRAAKAPGAKPAAPSKTAKQNKPPPGVLSAVEDIKGFVQDHIRWAVADYTCHEELDRMLARLRRLQRDTKHFRSVIPTRTADAFSKFTAWLTEHGYEADKSPFRFDFAAGESGDNATLFATRDIPKDELFIRVTGDLILVPDLSPESPIGRLVAAVPALSDMPSITLALTVLLEASDPKSRFAPYIGVLPATFTIPFGNFSAADSAALRPSPAASGVIKSIRAQIRNYTFIYSALHRMRLPEFPVSIFSVNNYIWAVSVAMTRQNAIPVRSPPPLALIPVWDMCNHQPGPGTTSISLTGDGDVLVESRAMRTFKAGEPITMFYGERPNTQLLQFSGFVQPDNAYDFVPIYLHLAPDADLAAFKAKVVLGKMEVEAKELDAGRGWIIPLQITTGADSIERALSVARILVTGKDGISAMLKSGSGLPCDPLEDESEELTAQEIVRNTLFNALNTYQESEKGTGHAASDQAKELISQLHDEEKKLLLTALSAFGGFGSSCCSSSGCSKAAAESRPACGEGGNSE